MNQWLFVGAAYAFALIATVALIVWAWASMNRAEGE